METQPNHQQHGSIPILESSITVSRDIPPVLAAKVHWIEWSMFCDRLDDALKPLRIMAMGNSNNNNNLGHKKSKSTTFRFRQKCIQSKTLKNLQRVCDKHAAQYPSIIREFILYCPFDGRSKTVNVTNWHIQVVARMPVSASSSRSFDIFDAVPTSVFVPVTPTSTQSHSSLAPPPPYHSIPVFHPTTLDLSSNAGPRLKRPSRFSFSRRDHPPCQDDMPQIQQRRFSMSSSSIATSEGACSLTNPFVDDPNDGLAMSRDGLMELDRQMDVDEWNQVPAMTPDMCHDQMPIPLAPPAPYQKVV